MISLSNQESHFTVCSSLSVVVIEMCVSKFIAFHTATGDSYQHIKVKNRIFE